MNLVELKKELISAPLNLESLKIIEEIFEAAIPRGTLTPEEKEKIALILEAEEEIADIEATVAQDAITALDQYGKEIDAAVDTAISEIEDATK